MAAAPITDESIKAAITERLKAIHVEVTDISGGCGQAFSTLIVSPEFEAQSVLRRHRMVNKALKEEIAQIHAWSAKCQSPAEWERSKTATPAAEGDAMDT